MYKSMFSSLPSDLLSSILHMTLQASIPHTAILAQVNRAFYHTVQQFWKTNSFLVPICLQYSQEPKDRNVDLDEAFFGQCSEAFLKRWIQLHHIKKYAITVENILNRFDEAEQELLALSENLSPPLYSSALFQLDRLKASILIHPQGSYHLDLTLFDIGFKKALKCHKTGIQRQTTFFIMGAYWRNLLQKYSNELEQLYQDFRQHPFDPYLQWKKFEKYLLDSQETSEQCIIAKKACINFTSKGLTLLDQNIADYLKEHDEQIMALAHPDASRLITCIQDSLQVNDFSLSDLATVCPHRLYTLCMRPYLSLLEAKMFTFSQLIHLDNNAFVLLGQPVSDGLSSPAPLADDFSSFPKRPLDEDSSDLPPHKKQKCE